MEKKTPRILIVIPLYNHGKTIKEVIRQCLCFHDDILVIDDGSTDLPEDIFDDCDITLIRHEKNLGKGSAIMTAAKEAVKRGMTHIVTIDADLQHHPEDFLLFKQAILEDPTALYVGKRDFSSPLIPRLSKFGRQFSNFWYRVQTGHSIGDAQSGFRAYPLFVLEGLKLSQTHFSFEVEVLVKSSWAGVNVRDLDISVYYPAKEERVSHFRLIKDNARLTHVNILLTLRSFLPIRFKKLIQKKEVTFSIFKPAQSIRYFLLNEVSPFTIAISAAMGVFLGTLPLIALHMLSILLVAGFFKLNKIVALGASQICMPPFVPALCIELGYYLTHQGEFLLDISLETLGRQCLERLYEWFLGSLIVAPILSVFAFLLFFFIANMLSCGGQKSESEQE
ncbi:MAG: DUF2062 domain-containing protein [Pseudomonadota bacterium]